MNKYKVNYNRKFPDHRIPHDFRLYQAIKSSPIERFKVPVNSSQLAREGFFNGFSRYPQVYIMVGSIFLLGAYTFPKAFDRTTEDYVANTRIDKTGNK